MNRIVTFVAVGTLLTLGGAASPLAAQATQPTTAAHASRTARQSRSYKRDLPADLAKQATVSEADAAKTAREHVKGRIQAVELENESGKLIYSYEIKVRGKSGVEEVNVDAKTGEVVNTEHETAKAEKKEAAQEKKEARATKKEAKEDRAEAKKPAKPTR